MMSPHRVAFSKVTLPPEILGRAAVQVPKELSPAKYPSLGKTACSIDATSKAGAPCGPAPAAGNITAGTITLIIPS